MEKTKIIRLFSTCNNLNRKKELTNVKNKGISSQLWLKRQLSDPYVERAKIMNYRCRSAFKLLEIDERFNILTPGQIAVDCGAAPGSWSQVLANKVNSNGKLNTKIGKVIAIDRQHLYPIEGVTILGNSDFTSKETKNKLINLLEDNKVNCFLSDMAPKASGIKELDNEAMMNLCYSVLHFAIEYSEQNANLLVKMWQCGLAKKFTDDVSKYYSKVKFVKPESSRSDSAEIFVLGRAKSGVLYEF